MALETTISSASQKLLSFTITEKISPNTINLVAFWVSDFSYEANIFDKWNFRYNFTVAVLSRIAAPGAKTGF